MLWLAGAGEIEVTFLFFKYWNYLVRGSSCWFCTPVICYNIKGKKKGILKSSCFVTALSLTSRNGYLLSTECKSISRLKPNSLIYILLTALSFPVKQEEKVIRYEAAVLLMGWWVECEEHWFFSISFWTACSSGQGQLQSTKVCPLLERLLLFFIYKNSWVCCQILSKWRAALSL